MVSVTNMWTGKTDVYACGKEKGGERGCDGANARMPCTLLPGVCRAARTVASADMCAAHKHLWHSAATGDLLKALLQHITSIHDVQFNDLGRHRQLAEQTLGL